MKRRRLDKHMVEIGLAASRERARELIESGQVKVDGMPAQKPASQVAVGASVVLTGPQLQYVSRGGLKLHQALDAFNVDVAGAVVLDVGASTGGFTDCVLQRGAKKVYAVDVGYGQLAWKLRADDRVVVLERTNVRALTQQHIPESVDVIVVDCSFIGLDKVVPPATVFMKQGGQLLALVKPQFEVGRGGVGKGGVVRDAAIRSAAIDRVRADVEAIGYTLLGGVDCDTHGPSGNVEYLLHAEKHA
ncbi:MAG: 23S rRNA (cytidine1920-2'-O)/16S rRNA (cytidine1409-2'-O)-methyltransferase [Flavobacteriales bacterium]